MFKSRANIVRLVLLVIGLIIAWNLFQRGVTSPDVAAKDRISYSQMLEYAEKGQVLSATVGPGNELVAMVAPLEAAPKALDETVTSVAPNASTKPSDPKTTATASANPPLTQPAVVPSATNDKAKGPVLTVPRLLSTTMPNAENDLTRLLSRQSDVSYKQAERASVWPMIFMTFGPVLLMVGLFYWLMRRSGGAGPGQAMSFGKSKAQMVDPKTNKVRFTDVAGCDEAKAEVAEVVEYLRDPVRFEKVGGKMPHGLLMSGPPGTGKTLLARAMAGEAGVPFFSMAGSDFVEMFVGVGAARVRDTFEQAKKHAPSIIFIDEIDAVGRQRSSGPHGGGNDEREQTLNQLLTAMDGFDDNAGVVVIAATNRADMLDEALKRPGRFDREVAVGLPDRLGRAQILAVHAKKIVVDMSVDWDVIARGTPGFSGAELANLINEAALAASRGNRLSVSHKDLEWARDRVMMGAEKLSGLKNEKERRITAYHEAGHALVARMIDGTDPVHKITIVPRGRSLGLTMQLPKEDSMNYERSELRDRIAVLMGGRAAEEVGLQVYTAGASNDFSRAAQMARRMVAVWGMDDEIGPVSVDGEYGAQPGYDNGWSQVWKEKVDEKVAGILREEYARARSILQNNFAMFEHISLVLLEKETLDADEFEALVVEGLAKAAMVLPSSVEELSSSD